VVTQSVNGNASYFQILTGYVIFSYEALHFVAHRLVYRSLTGDCRKARGLSTTTSLFNSATMSRCYTAQFSRSFTFG
jgi:hypothetical protein